MSFCSISRDKEWCSSLYSVPASLLFFMYQKGAGSQDEFSGQEGDHRYRRTEPQMLQPESAVEADEQQQPGADHETGRSFVPEPAA
jgi:hypothetical protein